ncbi:MAG: hypothetical protein R3A10_21960 [Caldilineaceae bacterium]
MALAPDHRRAHHAVDGGRHMVVAARLVCLVLGQVRRRGHIPMAGWVYVLLAGLTVLAVVGLVRLVIARRPQFPRDAVWVLLLALGSVALVMWRYSLVAPGRTRAGCSSRGRRAW